MRIPSIFRSFSLAAGLLCLTVGTARAQNHYLSLGLGTSESFKSSVHLTGFPSGTDVTFGGVTWRTAPLVFTPYYTVKYGQYLGRHWGAEFDFTHNKAIARTEKNVSVNGVWENKPISTEEPMDDKVQTLRFTNGVNILSTLALYRFTDSGSRWTPYIGLGPSYYLVWSRNTINDVERFARYHGVGWGWQGETGLRYRLGRRQSLYTELKYTAGPGKSSTADNGTISTYLRTFHQTIGYSFMF